jgi:hypothetical protein
MHYDIKPFKDEVLCDVSPLEVCDVLLGKLHMLKHHDFYESRPRSIIITLGGQLYRVPKAVPSIVVSLVSAKKYIKVMSQTKIFVLFMVWSKVLMLGSIEHVFTHRSMCLTLIKERIG